MLNILAFSLLLNSAVGALTYRGVDWSSLIVEEKAGIKFSTTAGTTKPLEDILVESGVTTVRQRIWVTDGDYGLGYNIALAKRAYAAGLNVYLDFHYSETWADPSHQATPAAWANYNIGDLKYAVYNYTLDTMNAFATAGVPLALVSIGNEITSGLLFPLGDVAKSPQNVAAILHSASAGVKDSKMATKPKILVHLDNGWNFATQKSWYDSVLGTKAFTSADYDVQAVSYYPFYNSAATLASLKSTLSSMKTRYGKGMSNFSPMWYTKRANSCAKELMVVETDWPTSCPSPQYAFPSDTTNIPFSPAGQTTWMKKVAGVVSDIGGTGLFYWEPAWPDNPKLGSSCDYNLMVSSSGQSLSSLAVFGQI